MVTPHVLPAEATPQLPDEQPHPQRAAWPRVVLVVLAVAAFIAALLVVGLEALIPFGLLVALIADADEEVARRSVPVTPRNLGLAAAMAAAFAGFWLWHLALTESTLVLLGAALMALPLALQDSAA